jgi:putative addiction module antidote
MYREIKLQRAGGSSAVNVPKAMLERHHLDTGDRAYVVDTEEGILITPYDPTFAKAMEIAERGAKKYRNALRELAK